MNDSDAQLIHLLSTNAWFGTLPVAELERIAATARYHWATSGEVIVSEGELGDTFFLIVEGTVIVSTTEGGKRSELAKLSTGQFFGEVAVLKDKPRTATVTAVGDVELFVFDRNLARTLAERYPAFAEAADALILARSMDTINKIVYK